MTETQIDQLEDPGVIDEAPQESRKREPIGNTTHSGRSIKLLPRMARGYLEGIRDWWHGSTA